MQLTDGSGQAATQLSQASSLTISATLTATNNGNVVNQLIEFSLNDAELAVFGNTAATALTNAQGVATISLLVGTKSGAGTVTAAFGDRTANAGFNSAGDGGGEVDVTVGSVALIADTLQLGSGSGSAVELSALVRDTNNVVLADIPVVFSSDSGEIVQIDAVTGANGVAKATLSTQTNKNIRDILVSARVQQQNSTLTVSVVGTKVEIAAPSSVVLGDTTSVDVFLTDSNDSGIQGQEVVIVSSLGNTVSDTSPITAGSAGKATFSYTAVNSGVDILSVSALGSVSSTNINISADAFAFIQAADEGEQVLEVNLDTPQELSVEWLVNNTPNVGDNVTFNTTRGEIADAAINLDGAVTSQDITDIDGQAQTVVRSQFAGLSTISATGGEGSNTVKANKIVEFVAVVPTKIEVQAFPAQVGPGETSTVRAIVRDANNNPVKNQTVVFSLDNAAGGVISSGTAITNSQGLASTVFTADTNTGAGVGGLNLQIKGTLQANSAVEGMTDIAVGERTLFFRFGTGNTITKPNQSLYAKEFSIIVTDSSGNPVANQQLNVAAVPVSYGIGEWVKDPAPPAAFKVWSAFREHTCVNEDADLNGILDLVDNEIGTGEDRNKDGMLTPGNAATVPQVVTADENGIATFEVRYPQDHGAWLDIRLQVSGFAAGTENVAHREYTLAVSSEDTTNEASQPPRNPFGAINDCFSPPKYF
ncbi:Ig-like domain-containing protein [Rheinheimera maricola]|uniref:Ig-like domain-containing protein n=1 Tax=Rheinheimera maricola TaxID=2793282 RepID=A0ABS7X4R4_9GAMM|nr:Ig-like domain-containing protein [Rheinheimera maricola]